MNPELDKLHPYPFEKLAHLKSSVTPPAELEHIALSIGEPKHAAPEFVFEVMRDALPTLANYPLTKGSVALRQAIAQWLTIRFHLPQNSLDVEQHILPVNGTREALFAFAQAVVNRRRDPLVLMPNPFYQIYEGAALLAGAGIGLLDDVALAARHITQSASLVTPDAANTGLYRRRRKLFNETYQALEPLLYGGEA